MQDIYKTNKVVYIKQCILKYINMNAKVCRVRNCLCVRLVLIE